MVPTPGTLAGEQVLLVMAGEEVAVPVGGLGGQGESKRVGDWCGLRDYWAQQPNVKLIQYTAARAGCQQPVPPQRRGGRAERRYGGKGDGGKRSDKAP